MKRNIIIGIIIIAVVGVVYFTAKKEVIAPETTSTTPNELCFAKFGTKDSNGFYDKYTLRLAMTGEQATGELKLIPAEKDALVGKFIGTVAPADKVAMFRTAELFWDTQGEGMTAKQELRIMWGGGTANIGFGEMTDRGDGVYVYKDPAKIDYSLALTDTSCPDLSERESVESYLWGNIKTLSPIKTVLGGSWYVVSMTVDLEKNSGVVTYEDGHVQEKKNFSYTTNEKREVVSLTIVNSINPVACTQEAKQCPDGSYVGRTGPNCEFALCPNVSTSNKSGITGTVTLSPTCPVERIPPDPNCAPKPYSTSINIMKSGSTRIIKTIQSNSQGAFSVDLNPGAYVLQAQGGNILPRCGEVTVEVKNSKYTTTEISCDTGIR